MKKYNGFSSEEWHQIKIKVFSGDYLQQKNNVLIIEKLRKFCSYYGRDLGKESKKRFRNNAIFELENIMDILLFCSLKENFNYFSNKTPIDQAYLNAAFYCYDALKEVNSKKADSYNIELKKLLKSLEDYLVLNKKSQNQIKNNNIKFYSEFEKFLSYKNKINDNSSIVIFSSGLECPISICLIELCIKLDIPIKFVVVKNRNILLSIIKNFLKGKLKIIKKIFMPLLKNNLSKYPDLSFSIHKLRKNLSPKSNNILEIAAKKNIPILNVNKFEEANKVLKINNLSIGFFAGGGIISQETIDCFSIGIINAHKGFLPLYKGMNVAQASIAEDQNDLIGLTTHLIESGIDTGPIIRFFKVNYYQYTNINSLKNEMRAFIPFLIIFSYFRLVIDSFNPIKQEKIGRQYYVMHKILRNIVSNIFKADLELLEKTDLSKEISKILDKINS